MPKVNKLLKLLVFLIISNGSFVFAEAKVSPPEPPAENPHTPLTAEDKKRVAFAELAIKKILMEEKQTGKFAHGIHNPPKTIQLNIDEACLKNPACLQKNPHIDYLNQLKKDFGYLTEFKYTHIIPWSFESFKNKNYQPAKSETQDNDTMVADVPVPQLNVDEYMIHTYVRFETSQWYHFNIIVTEDAKGNILLRRFFTIPIPSDPLPPGVDC